MADKLKLYKTGIAETFLNVDVLLSELGIDGYFMYRKNRRNFEEGKAGGVIPYIKNEIISYECTDLNRMESESVRCKSKVDGSS